MRNIKNIYTKAHFSEQAFAQMLHKDIRNLYKNIISFFLTSNNRKLSRNIRKWVDYGKNKEILFDKVKNCFF